MLWIRQQLANAVRCAVAEVPLCFLSSARLTSVPVSGQERSARPGLKRLGDSPTYEAAKRLRQHGQDGEFMWAWVWAWEPCMCMLAH